MLTKGDWFMITQGKKNGKYLKDIAEELGVHPRTVRRALDRGGPGKVGRPSGTSKLAPYKSWIDQRLGEGVWNAVVLYREIQEQGYSGEITLVRDYIRPKRVLRSSNRRTVRFETLPGQQMQNDWGEIWTRIGGTVTNVYFSVNTLGYSRRFHFWGTDCLDAEHTYEGILRAFEWFWGGMREVLVDNQKTAVITHRTGETPVFHPRFLDLASHDEIGYLPLSREEASLFFRLLCRRYEKASLILTSNKSFLDWGDVFGDQTLATAILDRLLHHATTVNIKGESFRLKERRRSGLMESKTPVTKEDTPKDEEPQE